MYFAAAVLAFTPCRRSIATTFTAQIYLTQSVYKKERKAMLGFPRLTSSCFNISSHRQGKEGEAGV